MSRFKTVIPVNITAVVEKFPTGTNIESVRFNDETREVEIVWGNENLLTPYTFAVEYPLEMLNGLMRPVCVKSLDTPPVVVENFASEKTSAIPVSAKEESTPGPEIERAAVEPVASGKSRKVPRK